MSTFIGYTIGLECNGFDQIGKMIKIEYSRSANGTVILQAVSGRNLSTQDGTSTVTAEQFDSRPIGDVKEAQWAMKRCGWTLMSEDCK